MGLWWSTQIWVAEAYAALQTGDRVANLASALTGYETVLQACAGQPPRKEMAACWQGIGCVREKQGDLAGASAAMQQALHLYQQLGDSRRSEATQKWLDTQAS